MFKKLLLCVAIIFCLPMEAKMELISSAFSHNEPIPAKYTCDGENISPTLNWSDAPDETQSFALIVDDPDAPAKTWVHWTLFNIPNTIDTIIENTIDGPFLQGATDFNGKQGYGGPCPPKGMHHYHFTLYALDTMLDLPAGATKEELLHAMLGHILEQTTLIGTYQRKK